MPPSTTNQIKRAQQGNSHHGRAATCESAGVCEMTIGAG